MSRNAASERRCAARMYLIMRGGRPLQDEQYNVDELAERYLVHVGTVYRGVRLESPLFPRATRIGTGPRAWLYFTATAIEACDRNRIRFYRTTPSWHDLYGEGASAAPARRSAKALIQPVDGAKNAK